MGPVSPDNVEKTGVWSGSPIVAAEAEQVERTRRKTWSRADPRFLCPSGSVSPENGRNLGGMPLRRVLGPPHIPTRRHRYRPHGERTGRQRALLDVTGPHTSYCFGPGGAGIGGCGAWTYCMYSRALRAFWSSVGPAIA